MIAFEVIGVLEGAEVLRGLVGGVSGIRTLLSKIKLKSSVPDGQVVTAGPLLDDCITEPQTIPDTRLFLS